MEQNTSKISFKSRMLPLFLLAASCGMYNILYLSTIFYVPFQSAFGFTNIQMGSLLAAYAVIATPGRIVCGLLADLWNPKRMLVCSLCMTAICGFVLSTIPSYSVTLAVFAVMGFSISFLYWAAYNKCVGLMGTNLEQGRLFGTAATIDGILTCTLTLGLTAIFGDAMAEKANFRIVIIVMSAFYFLVGIGLALFYDYNKWVNLNGQNMGKTERQKWTWTTILEVFKQPILWIAAVMVMGSYMASTCLTYMSPYLNAAYVLPVGLASAFGVITRYGVKVVAAPIGGTLRDTKLGGSTAKLAWIATLGVIVFVAVLLLLPQSASLAVPAVIIALCVIFCYRLNNSSESTTYRQLKRTPVHLIGTIVGLASVIGYSSDMWLPSVIGNIIDKNGNAGYKYVFLILCASMLLVSAGGVVLHILYQKEQREEAASKA